MVKHAPPRMTAAEWLTWDGERKRKGTEMSETDLPAFKGADLIPSTGGGARPSYPAEPGATYATDNRICPGCGTQRIFAEPRGRWVNVETGEEAEDQAWAKGRIGFRFEGFSHGNMPRSELCSACAGDLGERIQKGAG